MAVNVLNPLSDRRWDDLIARHPLSSVFHQRGWLEALCRTYGYQPLALTTSTSTSALCSGVVFCRVASWITGTRLVSLPFSDHCEPLLNDGVDLNCFTPWLRAECERQHWIYFELRPLLQVQNAEEGLCESHTFCSHELDLEPSLERLFDGLHKDCVQRKIRRAGKESLTYEVGCTQQLVDDFYPLLLITRRRHQLLPQPRAWFRNLIECMGDNVQIRLARKNGVPIAAMLTLRHRSSVVYKYGCSDDRFHNLGGMPFLFWKLIEESKAAGALRIDLGRSDMEHRGLVVFKDRLGASRKSLAYYRYPKSASEKKADVWGSEALRQLFSVLPAAISSTAGRIVYKHVG